jgi:hypothetical protein
VSKQKGGIFCSYFVIHFKLREKERKGKKKRENAMHTPQYCPLQCTCSLFSLQKNFYIAIFTSIPIATQCPWKKHRSLHSVESIFSHLCLRDSTINFLDEIHVESKLENSLLGTNGITKLPIFLVFYVEMF